ncbi:unnamed protein product [Chrysoparadoxa australica]
MGDDKEIVKDRCEKCVKLKNQVKKFMAIVGPLHEEKLKLLDQNKGLLDTNKGLREKCDLLQSELDRLKARESKGKEPPRATAKETKRKAGPPPTSQVKKQTKGAAHGGEDGNSTSSGDEGSEQTKCPGVKARAVAAAKAAPKAAPKAASKAKAKAKTAKTKHDLKARSKAKEMEAKEMKSTQRQLLGLPSTAFLDASTSEESESEGTSSADDDDDEQGDALTAAAETGKRKRQAKGKVARPPGGANGAIGKGRTALEGGKKKARLTESTKMVKDGHLDAPSPIEQLENLMKRGSFDSRLPAQLLSLVSDAGLSCNHVVKCIAKRIEVIEGWAAHAIVTGQMHNELVMLHKLVTCLALESALGYKLLEAVETFLEKSLASTARSPRFGFLGPREAGKLAESSSRKQGLNEAADGKNAAADASALMLAGGASAVVEGAAPVVTETEEAVATPANSAESGAANVTVGEELLRAKADQEVDAAGGKQQAKKDEGSREHEGSERHEDSEKHAGSEGVASDFDDMDMAEIDALSGTSSDSDVELGAAPSGSAKAPVTASMAGEATLATAAATEVAAAGVKAEDKAGETSERKKDPGEAAGKASDRELRRKASLFWGEAREPGKRGWTVWRLLVMLYRSQDEGKMRAARNVLAQVATASSAERKVPDFIFEVAAELWPVVFPDKPTTALEAPVSEELLAAALSSYVQYKCGANVREVLRSQATIAEHMPPDGTATHTPSHPTLKALAMSLLASLEEMKCSDGEMCVLCRECRENEGIATSLCTAVALLCTVEEAKEVLLSQHGLPHIWSSSEQCKGVRVFSITAISRCYAIPRMECTNETAAEALDLSEINAMKVREEGEGPETVAELAAAAIGARSMLHLSGQEVKEVMGVLKGSKTYQRLLTPVELQQLRGFSSMPQAYIISLRRRQDRWLCLNRHAARQHLLLNRVDALDAKARADESIKETDVEMVWDTTTNCKFDLMGQRDAVVNMSPGERACAASHLNLWCQHAEGLLTPFCEAKHKDAVLIMEADAAPVSDFTVKAQALLDELRNEPFDICYLGYSLPITEQASVEQQLKDAGIPKLAGAQKAIYYNTTHQQAMRPEGYRYDRVSSAKVTFVWQLHAYLLTREGAKRLINTCRPIKAPVDIAVATELLRENIRGRVCVPSLAAQTHKWEEVTSAKLIPTPALHPLFHSGERAAFMTTYLSPLAWHMCCGSVWGAAFFAR